MDDRSSPNEALQINNTFSNAAATAPRCCPAEQTGLGSGVAASAPRHHDSGQLGSRRTPGTTSSSSTRSSKRQWGEPAQCQRDRSSGHHRVAASAPRHNDVDRTGSRRAPRTTSRAEQSGFDSGVAAYAPRLNGGYQTGSQRSPGTTSSYSDRSRKRQRCDTSDDHDDQAIGRGDHDVEPKDHEHFGNEYHRRHGVALAAIAPATRGMLHGNPQHPQRATKANHPRRRLAGTASGQTQPEAQTHAGSCQEQPRPHCFVKRHKKKKQSQQKQGWNKGVSPNAVW